MEHGRLTDYLRRKMTRAGDLRVTGLKRIAGGSSRETFSFDLEWTGEGGPMMRPMIARRDPTGGLLKTERAREFRVLEAMHRAGLRVPEPLFLELDESVWDRPFFIMHRATGRVTQGALPATEPVALREKIANDFLDEMARLQSLDYRALGLEWLGDPADLAEPARIQAAHWQEIYERDRMGEHYPVLSAAFAWLRANPVTADRITIVHGDFRSGNYLYDDNGIVAMLDWEMAHLGDPMEDLGWASMMFWGREELAGGMMEREAFYRLYESKTGHRVDRDRLFFYQVLGNAKMSVICLTGIRDFIEGRTSDAMMPFLELLLAPLFEDLANQLKLV
ncbi:MAG TPA: phosphotransferase family protein [Candidatus Binataceae bacterium]|nr:phosphotransferase family protein [Candidatus Binataceae bacterium]